MASLSHHVARFNILAFVTNYLHPLKKNLNENVQLLQQNLLKVRNPSF